MSLDDDLRRVLRNIPDFPKPGINFKDITPLLQDGPLFRRTCEWLAGEASRLKAGVLAGVEARGFLFAAGAATLLGMGVVPLRKKNKLPAKKVSVTYDLEYGQDTMEAHADAVRPGEGVLLVDDLLATGGTAAAGCVLLEKLGARVVACRFVVELSFLSGREKLAGRDVLSVVKC